MSTVKMEINLEAGAGKSNEAAAPVKRERGGYRGNRYKPAAVAVLEQKPQQKFEQFLRR
jgi:hypothetical protein